VFVACVLKFVLIMTVAIFRKNSGTGAHSYSLRTETRDIKCNPCLSSWMSRKCRTGQLNDHEELLILDGGCWPRSNSANSCVSLTGFAEDGSCSAFLRVSQRPSCQPEVWILVEHKEIGLLQLLVNSDRQSTANWKLECIEPLRVWKVAYNGLLR
jgi:hypothetical protein